MKTLVLLIILILGCQVYSQNITLEKKLENQVDLADDYFILVHPAIRYERVFDNNVLRIEENKIQVYDEELNRVSETNIEPVKSVGGTNYTYFASGEDYVYIVSYGAAFKSGNAESRLTSISKSGDSKSIMLSELIELRGVTGMTVVNNQLHLFYSRTTGAPTPYSDMEIFTSSIVFNGALQKQNDIFEFPGYVDNSKYNLVWQFDGTNGDNLVFTSCYWLNEKSKYSATPDKGYEPYQTRIELDQNNTPVLNETQKITREIYDNQRGYYAVMKYDPEKFEIKVSDRVLTQYRKGSYLTGLSLSTSDSEITNVYDQFYDLIGKGSSAVKPVIYLIDAVEDPINKNINLVIRTDMRYYILTFDENFKLAYLYDFDASYYATTSSSYCTAFISGLSKCKGTIGTIPPSHEANAFDLVMKLNKKCQFAVLNFVNYQLLFTDDKISGETMVYKIE